MGFDLSRVAGQLLEEATKSGCSVRLLGGLAINKRCARGFGHAPELHRQPNDIDLLGLRRERARLETLFRSLGLEPQREFNLLGGGDRLLYTMSTAESDRVRVDVVLDRLEMCHVLKLAHRLYLHPLTISATDLLLAKLQVVFPSERDVKDTLALLTTFDLRPTTEEADHLEIDYICRLCGSNWGWHHTVRINLRRVEGWAALIRDDVVRAAVRGRGRAIEDALAACRKTLRWHLRNVIGERLRWYEVPEEYVLR